MTAIQQIYCTHCTYGSSALERREGELAHRMLGYSARAGSTDAPELRRFYRHIERCLYYYLPRDTPAEEKLRLTASTSPQRLVYLPSSNGLQVLGQICYRQTDTEGRPGSYFAHMLFREEKDGQAPWSVLDALKLWGAAKWVEEDSPEIEFRLPALGSLSEMLDSRRPAIDDRVLLSFLTAPANGAFDDPAGTIPARWRRMDRTHRTALFLDAFAGFLDVRAERREWLLLVAEPSVAAVLYYGIARLLPPGELQAGISFSTFEPNSDRIPTALAATWFCDPQHGDVRAEAYRSRGLVVNTCNDRRSEGRQPASLYAETMVRCLQEEGWQAVQYRLRNLQLAGAGRPDELNALAAVDRVAAALFDPRLALPADDWRRLPAGADYLRRAVARRIAQQPELEASLESLVGQPAHLLLLELIAVEPEPPGTRIARQFLLRRLPGPMIAGLLKLPGVSAEVKLDVLAHYVAANLCLPPGCEGLWSERSPGSPPAIGGTILSRLLARLPAEKVVEFYGRGGRGRSDAFLAAAIEACRRQAGQTAGLTRIIETVDDDAILSLVHTWGPAILEGYPEDEPALGRRLQDILGALPERMSQFPECLDLVLAGQHLLPNDWSLGMATAWAACRLAIHELGRLQEQAGVWSGQRAHAMEQAARRMAEAALHAMPPDRYQDDRYGTWKQDRLRQLGRRLLGKPLLSAHLWQHEAIWQKIGWFFETGRWPSAPLNRLHRRNLSPRKALAIGLSVALLVITLLVAGLYLFDRIRPSAVRVAGSRQPVPAKRAEPAPAAPMSRQREPLAPPSQPPAATDEQSALPAPPPISPPPLPDMTADQAEPPGPMRPSTPPPGQRVAGLPVAQDHSPLAQDHSPLAPKPLDAGESSGAGKPPGAGKPSGAGKLPGAAGPIEPAKGMESAKEPEAANSQPPAQPAGEAEWGPWAKLFAASTDAMLLEKQPLVDATFEIPLSRFRDTVLSGQFYITGGRLYLDRGVYEFGQDFDVRQPAAQREIPELARQCRLKSVAVSVTTRTAGPSLTVIAEPETLPVQEAAPRRRQIEELQKKTQLLASHLVKWRGLADSPDAQRAELAQLAALLKLEVPPAPQAPSRDDPRFKDDPKAFEQEMDALRAREKDRKELLDGVPRRAEEAIRKSNDASKAQQEQLNRMASEIRARSDTAIADLKAECRGISVVVYRSRDGQQNAAHASGRPARDKRTSTATSAADATSATSATEAAAAAATEAPPVQRLVPSVPAAIENGPVRDAADLTTAQVIVRVVGTGLNHFKRDYRIGCLLTEGDPGGAHRGSVREIEDVDAESSCLVSGKAETVGLRFTFAKRVRGEELPRPIAQTAEYALKVQRGKSYTVRLRLDATSQDMISRLKAE